MKAHVKVGRPFGVEVGLHFSWFVIAVLILLSLAQRFRDVQPDWSVAAVWWTASATALLFFVALVLHELSHALVARSRGIPVRSITLFALGGVAETREDASDPAGEFWMAIAGPVASLAIGGTCLGAARMLGWVPMSEPQIPVLAALVWLGYINLSLALFNMIPAFPMDGGRILRAALWRLEGDVLWATRWSARVGQTLAVGMMLLGLLQFLSGGGAQGLWLALIGWFLLTAAAVSYGQLELAERLRGVRVADVMRRDCLVVDGATSLEDFVKQHLLPSGGHCFVVTRSGIAVGLVTLHEVKTVPHGRWLESMVGEVMIPLESARTVSPRSPLSESVEIMSRDGVQQLPVLEGGRLLGVVSRGSIQQFLRTRAELHV